MHQSSRHNDVILNAFATEEDLFHLAIPLGILMGQLFLWCLWRLQFSTLSAFSIHKPVRPVRFSFQSDFALFFSSLWWFPAMTRRLTARAFHRLGRSRDPLRSWDFMSKFKTFHSNLNINRHELILCEFWYIIIESHIEFWSLCSPNALRMLYECLFCQVILSR